MTRSTERLPNNPLHPVSPDRAPNLTVYTDTQPVYRTTVIQTNKREPVAMQSLALEVNTLVLPTFTNKMTLWQSLIRQIMQKDACGPWHDGHG